MLDWGQTVFGGPWGFVAACGVVLLCDLVYMLLGFGALFAVLAARFLRTAGGGV